MDNPTYSKWKQLQSNWDDDAFLKSLTSLMRLRYRRLDEKVDAILSENFESSGVKSLKPLSWIWARGGVNSLSFFKRREERMYGTI